jgi:pimeloyl-ACP methyl ester carboxylesterase
MRNKLFKLSPLIFLFALTVGSLSQEKQVEALKNDGFQINDVNLGSKAFGPNLFSASIANLTAVKKNFVIDLRTECIGLGNSNWQRQFFYRLEPNEIRRVDLEYEILSPFLNRIILRFGESATYFNRDEWERLPAKEQEANPPPEVKYIWNKVISDEGKIEDEGLLSALMHDYSSSLNDLPKERMSQIESNLTSLIRESREKDNALRRKLFSLFRIDRECPKGYDYQESTWNGNSQNLNSLFDKNNIYFKVFSISSDAGNRISAFIASNKKDFSEKKPLVILLSGNPPGVKESLASSAVYLARLGYHTVGIDRRLTSRTLDKKEKFLSNFSDPVFDTLRIIDFLRSQSEIKISKIGIYGRSAGAEEGKFVAALSDKIDAAVLACGITSNNWLFKDDAWVPTYSGMIIFPELGLGTPDIANLTREQFFENIEKVKPEHNQRARGIFNKLFPYFEDLDALKVAPLIAPVPLMIITGAQDEQFSVPGVVEVDEAVRNAYQAYGLRVCSELYIQPRMGHGVDNKGGLVISAFLKRWLR